MIKGKVLLEDGQVFEVEFDSLEDGIQADYILWRDTRQQYDFYYNQHKLNRLTDEDLDEDDYNDDDVSFMEDIMFLQSQIDIYEEAK